jgi:hypothetical protein
MALEPTSTGTESSTGSSQLVPGWNTKKEREDFSCTLSFLLDKITKENAESVDEDMLDDNFSADSEVPMEN